MVSHCSLSDCKSPGPVSVFWPILIPLVILFPNPCTCQLVTVPRALITTGITVSFMFHIFSDSLQGLGTYLSFHFLSVSFCASRDRKVHNSANSIFLLIITRSGRLAEMRWSVCISKPQMILCISFSRTDSGCAYTQSCVVLYSFWIKLLHSVTRWMIVSSLSPHNWHPPFLCILSILAFIWLVFMELFWAAIRRDSVSLSRFPFFSHVHLFLCEISLSC